MRNIYCKIVTLSGKEEVWSEPEQCMSIRNDTQSRKPKILRYTVANNSVDSIKSIKMRIKLLESLSVDYKTQQ